METMFMTAILVGQKTWNNVLKEALRAKLPDDSLWLHGYE